MWVIQKLKITPFGRELVRLSPFSVQQLLSVGSER
jgi:hypothetical protein